MKPLVVVVNLWNICQILLSIRVDVVRLLSCKIIGFIYSPIIHSSFNIFSIVALLWFLQSSKYNGAPDAATANVFNRKKNVYNVYTLINSEYMWLKQWRVHHSQLLNGYYSHLSHRGMIFQNVTQHDEP